jgi:general secretion pathway protein L
LLFENSHFTINDPSIKKKNEHSLEWIARKLLNTKPLNLCQGDMQQGNTSAWIRKGYILSAVSAGIWLFSIILTQSMVLHSLNKQTRIIDSQIATIYHQFFPEAKQVISPKFRISQLLSKNSNGDQSHFWLLIAQFEKIIDDSVVHTQQLRYQNKTLFVTVVSPDFANLEQLENNLKKASLKVSQTEASTQEQQVIATLELS